MANNGCKKVRKIKNLGTVYYDNCKERWVGQIETGSYANGRKRYKKFYSKSQTGAINSMQNYTKENSKCKFMNEGTYPLFSQYADEYLRTIKKVRLKPSSYCRERQLYKNQLCPYLGGYTLDQLTSKVIQTDVINKMLDQGYSYSTIHKVYVLINEILKYACKNEIISKNPCEMVEKPSRKIFINPKEIRFFDDEEIQRFKESALLREPDGTYHYRNGLALVSLIYSGLRIGELLALKWKDVNLKDGFLNIHRNVSVSYTDNDVKNIQVQEGTKTSKGRIVHLTKSALECYKQMHKLYCKSKDEYVYSMLNQRDVTRAYNTYSYICKRAQIENHQGLHTLRHTCASLLIRKGVDIKIISDMLGHRDSSFTYNVYVHLVESEKAKVLKELDI